MCIKIKFTNLDDKLLLEELSDEEKRQCNIIKSHDCESLMSFFFNDGIIRFSNQFKSCYASADIHKGMPVDVHVIKMIEWTLNNIATDYTITDNSDSYLITISG